MKALVTAFKSQNVEKDTAKDIINEEVPVA